MGDGVNKSKLINPITKEEIKEGETITYIDTTCIIPPYSFKLEKIDFPHLYFKGGRNGHKTGLMMKGLPVIFGLEWETLQ